jgi:hypothetical protein
MFAARHSHGVTALTRAPGGLNYGCSEGSAEEALRDRTAGGKPFEPDPGHAGEGTETLSKTRPSRIVSRIDREHDRE